MNLPKLQEWLSASNPYKWVFFVSSASLAFSRQHPEVWPWRVSAIHQTKFAGYFLCPIFKSKSYTVMKKILLLPLVFASIHALAQAPYFLSNPSLTPDGSTIYFCFESDIWKTDTKGGQATRVTAMPGIENNPRVSPDGKWLAFTSNQYGNNDVYTMPLGGGDIKQLTFNSANDQLNSWAWNSRTLYFTSNRYNREAAYTVGINGGTPTRLFNDYFFSFDHNIASHPTSGELFFNDTWESSNQAQRKRYKGPFNPDIQSYNPVTKQYKRYTDWEGKDFGAMLDSKGNLYFISDEGTGEYNLFTIANGKKTALTRFNSSIKAAQVNANGGKIVFQRDYQLWLYDVASGKAQPVPVTISRNNILSKAQDFDVKAKISSFDISPDGKKLAFISRGEIFVSDVEGKIIQQVNKGNAERATEVMWKADNKTLIYTQTVNGYLNLFSIRADTVPAPKELTRLNVDHRNITYNKTRSKALFFKGKTDLCLMDLKTMDVKTIAKDEFWGSDQPGAYFSPNDEWVVYCAFRNFEHDIFLYNVKGDKSIDLTNSGVTETNPVWSPDSKYIYFTTNQTKPSYPFGLDGAHIYRLPLEKWDDPFKMEKYNELFKKDTTKKKDSSVTVDASKIMERLERISPVFGSQDGAYVIQKADKTTVLYISNHAEGTNALWKTIIEPFVPNKTEKVGDANSYSIVEADGKYFVLSGGNICKLNLDAPGNKIEPILMSYTFRKNLQEEFAQMFKEAWAKVEINFYDEKFHGINWKETKEKYQQFIPYITNRADLSILLNDMLGELNSSHMGFSSTGDDTKVPFTSQTTETGIVWDRTEPYKVNRILKQSVTDKKAINIQPGDVLTAVNGEAVNMGEDRNKYFTQPSADKELKLSFIRPDKTVYDVFTHTQNTIGLNLHSEWEDQCQQKVDEKSNNRIGYFHMRDMGSGELERFLVDATQDFYKKDALILDLRYNTGGNVHDEVLKFLQQKAYLKWKYREGALTTQSNFAPSDKPIVLLVNEQSLSDAEMTATGFKALKLGKIIGNDTYHWIIFTGGVSLVDGSTVRLPSWGCYTLDGKDIESNGVQPDIKIINTWEDKMNGRDPQLDRAIEEILKDLQ
ncbi:MAG: S41 family peptidase [Chitinophagaceae bacterium]